MGLTCYAIGAESVSTESTAVLIELRTWACVALHKYILDVVFEEIAKKSRCFNVRKTRS